MGKTQRIVGAALVALALGLAAYAWVLSERMTSRQQEGEAQLQPVVVAATRIAAGSVIAPEMLRQAMFPARPDGAYADIREVAGKATASDIAAGEPLLQERVENGMQAMLRHLEPGQRAVAVRVDDVVAVGNRLNPGDLVDVYVTLRRNNDEIADTQSRLLLEKLKVLAFGSKDLNPSRGAETAGAAHAVAEMPKNAVLAVASADVDKLALAAESGRLLLALRPQEKPAATGPVADPAAAAIVPVGANATAVATTAPSATPAPAAPVQPQSPAITLHELLNGLQGVDRPRPGTALRSGSLRYAATPPAGTAVTVMHGLKEKTVYLDNKKIEARK